MLVTFSGLDGAGKTTQLNNLKRRLESDGCSVKYVWARGGYTPGFEFAKRFARRLFRKKAPPAGVSAARTKILARNGVAKAWLVLAMVDLILYWGVYARFLRLTRNVVICDRYLDDTRVDFLLNFPAINFQRWPLWRMLVFLIPKPDAAFMLWVSVEESMRRSELKKEPFPDDEKDLKKRLDYYLDSSQFPEDKYYKIDGGGSLSDIESDIATRVKLIGEYFKLRES